MPSSLERTKNARMGSKNCHCQRLVTATGRCAHGIAQCPYQERQTRQDDPRVRAEEVAKNMSLSWIVVIDPQSGQGNGCRIGIASGASDKVGSIRGCREAVQLSSVSQSCANIGSTSVLEIETHAVDSCHCRGQVGE